MKDLYFLATIARESHQTRPVFSPARRSGIQKLASLALSLLITPLIAGCNGDDGNDFVRDARVASVYAGPQNQVVKKLGDVDGNLYNQNLPQAGDPAFAPGFRVLSAVDFALLTYVATKQFFAPAVLPGGVPGDQAQVFREVLPGEPTEMVTAYDMYQGSNPALAVMDRDLYLVWVGEPNNDQVFIKKTPNGNNWTDVGQFLLAAPLLRIDLAAHGDNLLLAGFENDTVVLHEIGLSPPRSIERFVVAGAGAQMAAGHQVSLAVSGDTVLVAYSIQPAQSVADPCNLDRECRSRSCRNGLCVGIEPPPDQSPGLIMIRGLSLATATRGQTATLWSSGVLPVLQWLSAARIRQASDGPAPNDYILAAFRGDHGAGPDVFFCKWEWPGGTAPNWTLSPADCPQFLRLNDSFLDPNVPEFEVFADEFVRQRD